MPGETEDATEGKTEKPTEATAAPGDGADIEIAVSVPKEGAESAAGADGAPAAAPAAEGAEAAAEPKAEDAAAAGAEATEATEATAPEGAEGADKAAEPKAEPAAEGAGEGAAEPKAEEAAGEVAADAPAADGTADAAAATPEGAEGPPAEAPAGEPTEAPAEAPAAPAEGAEGTEATAGAEASGADAAPAPPAAEGDPAAEATEGTEAAKEPAAEGAGAEAETGDPPAPPAEAEASTDAEKAAEEQKEVDAATQDAIDKLSKGVEGVVGEFTEGLEAIPDTALRSALQNWASKMSGHVQELKSILTTARSGEAAAGDPSSSGRDNVPEGQHLEDEEQAAERLERESVTEEEMQSVRDIGRQLASHRTGRSSEEVASEFADPEESAKQVEELRRVRRQIRYIFGGMIQSLPDASSLRVDDLMSEAGTSVAQHPAKVPQAEKPPPLPGKPVRDPAYHKVPVPPQAKPDHGHNPGRPRSGGTELSSVTDSSAVSWNSQDDPRRREKKERKSKKQRHPSDHEVREVREVRDVRQGKKDDGTLPKPFNWAEEVVKASMDPQNQWDFPAGKGGGYVEPPQRAAWEQPRARGPEVASRARERAEEVQRWERQQGSHNQQYIFGSPRGY